MVTEENKFRKERIIEFLDEKKVIFTTNSIVNNIITSKDSIGNKYKHNNYAVTVPLDFMRNKDISKIVVRVSIEVLDREFIPPTEKVEPKNGLPEGILE